MNTVADRDIGLIDVLLDPDRVMMEQRDITLPLAGDVLLAIIRIAPGAGRSMDLLEHSVRTTESLIGTPFPTKYVGLLYDEGDLGSAAGRYHGTHIAIRAGYDVGDSARHAGLGASIIAHEVGHYYWHSNVPWIDEGLAQVMVRLVDQRSCWHSYCTPVCPLLLRAHYCEIGISRTETR